MATQPQAPAHYQQTTAQNSGGGQPAPQDGDQANGLQMLLAKWYQAAKTIGSSDPRLASGANKVAEGIQEMQTALVTPPKQTPTTQQPLT